jgi:hypothetical protein
MGKSKSGGSGSMGHGIALGRGKERKALGIAPITVPDMHARMRMFLRVKKVIWNAAKGRKAATGEKMTEKALQASVRAKLTADASSGRTADDAAVEAFVSVVPNIMRAMRLVGADPEKVPDLGTTVFVKNSQINDVRRAMIGIGRASNEPCLGAEITCNGKTHFVNLFNPSGSASIDAFRKKLRKQSAGTHDKRVPSTAAMVMYIGSAYAKLQALLVKYKDTPLRDLNEGSQDRQKLANGAKALVSLVLGLSRVGRGVEMSQESLLDLRFQLNLAPPAPDAAPENVVEVPLALLALLEPGAVSRPSWYFEEVRKGKQKAKLEYMLGINHDTLPSYASLLSVPDVMAYAVRILLAVAPEQLDPANNWGWWALPTAKGAKPDTKDLNKWLERNAAPACVARARGITTYGPRCLMAFNAKDLGLMKGRTGDQLRACMGHEFASHTLEKVYARGSNVNRCAVVGDAPSGPPQEEQEDAPPPQEEQEDAPQEEQEQEQEQEQEAAPQEAAPAKRQRRSCRR